jgi:uncharacterized membrane protein HdeD (DUF308 family)
MLTEVTRNWWAVALRGLAAVLFSIAAFGWPQQTLTALVLVFGAYLVVDGVFSLVYAFGSGTRFRGVSALEGLASIAVGIVALVWPGITTTAILYLIAAWAVVTGILEIIAAVWLRDLDAIDNAWLLGLGGLASVAFGVILAFQPAAGSVAIVWMLGAYALIFGVLLIALGFRLRSLGQQLEERQAGGRPSTGGAAIQA